MKNIYLAGGCFWGVDEYFSRIDGILNTESGYANGHTKNPTYEEVCSGDTGFTETVYVEYDEEIISLEEIIKILFKIIDPTQVNRQGPDLGSQYRSGIYYTDLEDKDIIEETVESLASNYDKKIVTEIKALENYYRAEEYHQDYLKKNPGGYCHVDMTI